MIFISLSKLRGKVTKENIEKINKAMASDPKVKALSLYWTLGRYDTVAVFEAPDEKTMLRMLAKVGDFVATETLVAIPRDEAVKLV